MSLLSLDIWNIRLCVCVCVCMCFFVVCFCVELPLDFLFVNVVDIICVCWSFLFKQQGAFSCVCLRSLVSESPLSLFESKSPLCLCRIISVWSLPLTPPQSRSLNLPLVSVALPPRSPSNPPPPLLSLNLKVPLVSVSKSPCGLCH